MSTGQLALHFGLIGKLKSNDCFLLRVPIDEFAFAVIQVDGRYPLSIFAAIDAALSLCSSFHWSHPFTVISFLLNASKLIMRYECMAGVLMWIQVLYC